jgi:phosphohistidine phosphatase
MRARQTAEMAAAAGQFGDIIQFEPRIYESSPQTLLAVAGQIDDQFSAAMLVGHNPGMEGFVRTLTGISESMPTAALAVIDLNIDSWGDIRPGSGTLREFIRPKHLMSPKK